MDPLGNVVPGCLCLLRASCSWVVVLSDCVLVGFGHEILGLACFGKRSLVLAFRACRHPRLPVPKPYTLHPNSLGVKEPLYEPYRSL